MFWCRSLDKVNSLRLILRVRRMTRSAHFALVLAATDATEAFFGMHRAEVLNKYGRYIIGTVEGQKPRYLLPTPGTLSPVPYAEATWLREGFKSPYYRDSHRALQKAMREFTDEHVYPDAQLHEKDGKRPTVELIQKMGEINMNAMVGLALPAGRRSTYGQTILGGVVSLPFDLCAISDVLMTALHLGQ